MLVGLGAASGQDQDRHVRAPLELTADVEPIAVGQVEVEQDQVGLTCSRKLERARSPWRRPSARSPPA